MEQNDQELPAQTALVQLKLEHDDELDSIGDQTARDFLRNDNRDTDDLQDGVFSPVDVDDFARFHYGNDDKPTNYKATTYEGRIEIDDEIFEEGGEMNWKEYIMKTARDMVVGVCAAKPPCLSSST